MPYYQFQSKVLKKGENGESEYKLVFFVSTENDLIRIIENIFYHHERFGKPLMEPPLLFEGRYMYGKFIPDRQISIPILIPAKAI